MVKRNLIIALIVMIYIYLFTNCKDDPVTPAPPVFPEITGEYLEQTPPGNTPVIFAPGIISTEKNECSLAAYPGGNELYYLILQTNNNVVTTSIFETKKQRSDVRKQS